MSLEKSDTDFGFDYTAYDAQSSLNVRAAIFDITSGSPSFVAFVTMVEAGSHGAYVGKYAGGLDGEIFAVVKRVYTDGTFTTIHPDYPAPATSIHEFADIASGEATSQIPQGEDLLLFVEDDELVLVVDEDEELLLTVLDCDD